MELMVEKEAAFMQIEEEKVRNELNYQEKLAKLECDQFRVICSQEMLEGEREMLAKRQLNESMFEYNSFEWMERIRKMENPTEEGLYETQLKVKKINEISISSLLTIFFLYFQVKEATQRCRNLGINYEFAQTQTADEFGQFAVVVNVIDRQSKRIAEWPTTRLTAWLDEIRNNDDITNANAFDMFDIDWLERSDCIDLNESLNSSRISLDISAMKNALLIQPIKNCIENVRSKLSPWTENRNTMPSPCFQFTKKKLTFDDINETDESPESKKISSTPNFNESFETQAQNYLRELRKTTLRFKKLCHQNANENCSGETTKVANKLLCSVEEMESLTNQMRKILKEKSLDAKTSTRKTPKTVRFILD